jgi:hypothetical protein
MTFPKVWDILKSYRRCPIYGTNPAGPYLLVAVDIIGILFIETGYHKIFEGVTVFYKDTICKIFMAVFNFNVKNCHLLRKVIH